MRARDHTDRMLAWWRDVGVDRVDLAIRRPPPGPDDHDPVWLWQRAAPLDDLPRLLPWTRAENARKADIYVRPARGSNWPVVFLDDLKVPDALELSRHHRVLCVHTSPVGGCQLWLHCDQPLDESDRYHLQKFLVGVHGADPGSVSGEHLGRLAGHRNWKRSGPWVNVLAATLDGQSISNCRLFEEPNPHLRRRSQPRTNTPGGVDPSESGREWGWVMGALKAGSDPETVYRRLVARARPRRGVDAERYARRTVLRALDHLGRLSPPQGGAV